MLIRAPVRWLTLLFMAPLGTASSQSGDAAATEDSAGSAGWWRGWGGVAEPDRLFGGLWVVHLGRDDKSVGQHHGAGIAWRGWYATTFTSSQGGRIWGLALSRVPVLARADALEFTLGYRVGVVRGYDGRFIALADRWPVLPAGEIVAALRYWRVGVALSFAGIVASGSPFVALTTPPRSAAHPR